MSTNDIPPPLVTVPAMRVDMACRVSASERSVPEEIPVALVVDGSTHAVLMATPEDLEDFALGLALSDGIITSPAEIDRIEIVPREAGIEARLWLRPAASQRENLRRRAMTGPTGCGLCGVESLAAALPPVPRVCAPLSFNPGEISHAFESLEAVQALGRESRAMHAAGFWQPGIGLIAAAEDVGRHNALDKVAGAVARLGVQPARGMVLLTSRVSVALVQKTARMGAPVIAAVSAPTALAIATAQSAGITLLAVVRADGFEVFSHPQRVAPGTEPLLFPRGPHDVR